MLNKSALGVAVAAALSFSVSADEQSIEHITVSANKFEQSINDVLASVTVIDRADIEASYVRDLPSLLATQAGFQINANGGFGQSSGVSLRGASSRHTLILIDGVRTGSATLGYKSISNIPLNSIERVEVIKGSRAAVYGSDALAGVINIITRKAQNTTLDVTFGSDSYQEYQVATGGQFAGVDVAVNAGYEKTDGFDVLQGLAPDEDGYENKNLGFNLGYQNEQLGEFLAQAQYSEGEAKYDSAYSPADSTVEKGEFENYQASLGWKKAFEKHSHAIDIAISSDSSDDSRIDYTGATVVDKFETEREQIDYNGQYFFNQALTLSGGLNWYKDEVNTNSGTYLKDSREVFAAFVGAYYDDEHVLANLTVRQDDDQQFGDETTYTAAVGYHLNDIATFRVSQSTGFKSPTFNDLYYPGSGNPELNPETSDNQELGLSLNVNDISLDIAIFRSEIDNKIAWAPNASGQWIPTNINEARHEGVEFSFKNQVFGFDHSFNFTYLSAEDTETGQSLTYVSNHTVNWSLNKAWGDFDAGIDLQYRGDRDGKLTHLPSYTLWNLVGHYQATDNLTVSLRVENLFDKEYNAVDAYGTDLDGDYINDEFYYYNTAERRLFVGARYQF
ncbi:TonB-dependent receptor domain-containing protein [Pseudoalteromonas gelatinilytica]